MLAQLATLANDPHISHFLHEITHHLVDSLHYWEAVHTAHETRHHRALRRSLLVEA